MTADRDHAAPSASPTAGPSPGDVNTRITPRANGPLVVDGPVTLVAADGSTTTADRLVLCRCGASGTKPLCDGTHKQSGFQADGVVPPRKPGP